MQIIRTKSAASPSFYVISATIDYKSAEMLIFTLCTICQCSFLQMFCQRLAVALCSIFSAVFSAPNKGSVNWGRQLSGGYKRAKNERSDAPETRNFCTHTKRGDILNLACYCDKKSF